MKEVNPMGSRITSVDLYRMLFRQSPQEVCRGATVAGERLHLHERELVVSFHCPLPSRAGWEKFRKKIRVHLILTT